MPTTIINSSISLENFAPVGGNTTVYCFDSTDLISPDGLKKQKFNLILSAGSSSATINSIKLIFPANLFNPSLTANNANLLITKLTTAFSSQNATVTQTSNRNISFTITFALPLQLAANQSKAFVIEGLSANPKQISSTNYSYVINNGNTEHLSVDVKNYILSPPPPISFGVLGNNYLLANNSNSFVIFMYVEKDIVVTTDHEIAFGFYGSSHPVAKDSFIPFGDTNAVTQIGFQATFPTPTPSNPATYTPKTGLTSNTDSSGKFSMVANIKTTAATTSINAGTIYQFSFTNAFLTDINSGIVKVHIFVGGIQGCSDTKYEVHFIKGPLTMKDNNVGIGTTTPGKKLDVNGYVRIKDHLIFKSPNAVINWGNTGSLYFRTNSTEGDESNYGNKVVITQEGNMGIGTISPTKKLDVTGDVNITGVTTLNGNVGIGTTSLTKKLDVTGDVNITGVTTLGSNVGIGTTSPTKKLDVNGDTHVSGATTLDGMVTVGTDNINADLVVKGRIRDKTGDVMPVGAIIAFGGASLPPAGWLLCNGQSIASDPADRSYQNLRSTLGANNVPDLRARFILGSGDGSMNFTGRPSEAILLDDANAYTVANSIPSFTYEVWFRTVNNAPVNNYNSILVKQWGWGLFVNSAGKLVSFCYSNTDYNRTSLKTCTDGLWHHAVISFNNNLDCKVYLDGVLISSSNNAGGYQLSGNPLNKRLYIGGSDSDSGIVVQPFFGDIKRVKVYNRALTAPEVQSQLIAKGEETSNLSGLRIDKVLTSKTGGEYEHQLSVEEMPSHNHSPVDGIGFLTGNANSGVRGYQSTDGGYYANIARNAVTSNSGGNQPHNNMPPYYALTYIIKY
jgi:microcystin-dependent protein